MSVPGIREVIAEQDVEIERLRAALAPFAAYADPRQFITCGFIITQGSDMAKRQITMGDCYAAKDALDGR